MEGKEMMLKLMNRKNKKGFTLIELIVVIAIIAILAAILIPRFGGFTDKAKKTQALVDAKQIATAIDGLIAEGNTASAADPSAVLALAFSTAALGSSEGAFSGAVGADGGFTWVVKATSFQAGRESAGSPVKIMP